MLRNVGKVRGRRRRATRHAALPLRRQRGARGGATRAPAARAALAGNTGARRENY